jgi:hypothetical protein
MSIYLIALILAIVVIILAFAYISKCDDCDYLITKLFKKDKQLFDSRMDKIKHK